jgi:hypothetical protein
VANSLARPKECLVGVGEGSVEGVRGRVWFGPANLIHHLSRVQNALP